jgi:hypothetical protein
MSTPVLRKSLKAGATVNPSRFVIAGAADNYVIQAVNGAVAILGVSVEHITAAAESVMDITMLGIEFIELGGTVARGSYVTADSVGRAVAANIVPGTELHVGGRTMVSGVVGDIVPIIVDPTVIATDTGIATAIVQISSAELLALNAAPQELVAAPGAGFALIVEDAQFFLDYNSAAYAGIAAGEDLAIRYTDGSGAIVATQEATGFLDATADAYRHTRPVASSVSTGGVAPVANAALVLHMLTGEIITGNSPLNVRVRYRTVAVEFAPA